MTRADENHERIAGRLLAYLREQLDDPTLACDGPFTPLLGGFVTAIYQFKLCGPGAEPAGPLVLRLYREGDDPESATRESHVQNALAKQGHRVAKVHHVCADKSVLGGAFFVMDFLPGELLIRAPGVALPTDCPRPDRTCSTVHRHPDQDARVGRQNTNR